MTAALKSWRSPYTRSRNVDSSTWRIVTRNPTAASRAWSICSSAPSPLPTVSSSKLVDTVPSSSATRRRAESGATGTCGGARYAGKPGGTGPSATAANPNRYPSTISCLSMARAAARRARRSSNGGRRVLKTRP